MLLTELVAWLNSGRNASTPASKTQHMLVSSNAVFSQQARFSSRPVLLTPEAFWPSSVNLYEPTAAVAISKPFLSFVRIHRFQLLHHLLQTSIFLSFTSYVIIITEIMKKRPWFPFKLKAIYTVEKNSSLSS